MKIEGIILAAGLSSRAGVYKLALGIEGKTIIERCIESMYNSCSQIIVVGGHNIEAIAQIVNKYSKVKLVLNSNYKDGMFSSVKEGLKNISGERFFLIPGDYPLVSCQTYKKLLTIDSDIVIPTYKGKKGHPILVKSYIIPEILYNSKYISLREFINTSQFLKIDTNDQGILMDVDTLGDYENILEHIHQNDIDINV